MRGFRFFSYPATLMLLLAGAYTLVRVVPSERVRVFAMLAMTAIGVTELVQAAAHYLSHERSGQKALVSLVIGSGGLLVGFSLLDGLATIAFVSGSLILGVGFLLRARDITVQT